MLKYIIISYFCFFVVLSATETRVLTFAGSTRNESVNKKLALEAASIASQLGFTATYIDLRDYPIPFYDGDLEKEGMPQNAVLLKQLMIENDVIMIASPEYNGSISAVLKNTLDWVSRNESVGPSRDAFKGKKVILMGASPGNGGGARGLKHLQAIIEDIGGKDAVVPKQITLPKAYEAFDSEGKLLDVNKVQEIKDVLLEVK